MTVPHGKEERRRCFGNEGRVMIYQAIQTDSNKLVAQPLSPTSTGMCLCECVRESAVVDTRIYHVRART